MAAGTARPCFPSAGSPPAALAPPLLLPRHAAVSDIYPEAVQLRKGEYVLRVVLRHDDAALLNKLKARGSWWPGTPGLTGQALCRSLLGSGAEQEWGRPATPVKVRWSL